MTTAHPPTSPESNKRKLPVWGSAALAGTVVLLASIGYIRPLWHGGLDSVDSSDAVQDLSTSEERPKAPAIQFLDQEGRTQTLKLFEGKVVLVSFWASWCGPCLEELPTFSTLAERLQRKGLEILAINVDDSTDEAKNFIPEFWKKKLLPFPSFFDTGYQAAKAFNVDVLPANYVLDRKGRIAFSGFGTGDWNAPEVLTSLEELLEESI